MIPIMRIYDGNRIVDIPAASFSNYTIGASSENDYTIRNCIYDGLTITRSGNQWRLEIVSQQEKQVIDVEFMKPFRISREKHQAIVFFNINQTFNVSCDLNGIVSIGRGNDCTIKIYDSLVSRNHAQIWIEEDVCRIADNKSTSGTYVNGELANECVLNIDDIIAIGTYYFTFDGTRIKSIIPKNLAYEFSSRPILRRSPRLVTNLEEEVMQIEPPPSIGSKPGFYLSSLMSPVGGLNYLFGSGMYKRREKLQLKTYKEYIHAIETELDNRKNWQLSIMEHTNPSVCTYINWPREMSERLWERTLDDNDFMSLRLGTGTVKSWYRLKAPSQQLSIKRNKQVGTAIELSQKSQWLENAPLNCSFDEGGAIGLLGHEEARLQQLNSIIVEATALHSYDELKIVGFMPKKAKKHWHWMRWLPHCFSDDRQMRYLADNRSDADKIIKQVCETLNYRENEEAIYSKRRCTPFYLIVIADPFLVEQTSLLRYLSRHDPEQQYAIVYLADSIRQLPKECKTVIEVNGQDGKLYSTESIQNQQYFICESASVDQCDVFARSIAPIQLEHAAIATPIPTKIGFLEGYNLKRPEELKLQERWEQAEAYRTLSVPIGMQENNQVFFFDIHEKKYGPNGIVAGMVGSGKTEMIQSWILSMSVHFSPQDVSFVLVDFKGSGLLLPFAKLPHLAGTISDLDVNISRNLIALKNEVLRREKLLHEANAKSILDYKKACKRGNATEPLPFLMIVIDEYAEFKLRFPEFTEEIESIFAKGRALGIYTVLMTQKPAGVVTGKMEANTRFRWCLKVASSADSKDMLKHPDAAQIKNPGRAFVRVGEDELFAQVQSFYSGAPYYPYAKDRLNKAAPIAFVDLVGRREVYDEATTSGFRTDKTETEAIVEYMDRFVCENGWEKARKIWEERLPDQIILKDIVSNGFDGQRWNQAANGIKPAFALADDPAEQIQYPLTLDLSGNGHAIIYGAPGSGKTTLLHTLIMSTAISYSPDDVNMYMMDFGGWSMGMFQNLPQVGGVANDNEDEKINKLAQLLSDELDERRKAFSAMGVGNLEAYRQITDKKLPYILLFVDNFTSVMQMYPGLESFFGRLVREGGNYGIILITTSNSSTSITYKIKTNIKTAVALQMTDRNMYSDIVGRTGGLVPENIVGRGLFNNGRVVEFQAALPVCGKNDGDRAAAIRSMCRRMNEAWCGDRPKSIPVMPDVISFGSVAEAGTVIGLNKINVEPISVDFERTHCAVISGTAGSGKSNLLKVIAKQLHKNGTKITVFDSNDRGLSLLRSISDNYCTSGEEMDSYVASLVKELQNRKTQKEAGENCCFEKLVLLVDNWKQCFDAIDNQTAKRLEMLVRLGSGLDVYLIIAGDSSELAALHSAGEAVVNAIVNTGTSILLGMNFRAHRMFDADVSYSEKEAKLGQYEGYIMDAGKPIGFKAMHSEE